MFVRKTKKSGAGKMFGLLMVLVILLSGMVLVSETRTYDGEFVVRIVGGPQTAKMISEEMGFHYKGPVRGFKNTYILVPRKDANSSTMYQKRGSERERRFSDDQRIIWAEMQQEKRRDKRDLFFIEKDYPSEKERSRRLLLNDKFLKRPPVPPFDKTFNDELWVQEWYMQDTRTRPELPKLDLNVLPVYRAGITGKGVRISILDDGIEYTHDDLKQNYDPDISWDCNEEDNDPMPRYEPTRSNSHGTRCAGEIAMIANNVKCGVGIAFNSIIGGVKLLDGIVNDRIEGTALSHARHLVDIYSASWGPNDDGITVDGPGRLAREAMETGVREGRGGRGNIFVWASGNGGSKGDNCNCDGYLNSPYTITIGSASQRGEFPWYGEACASTLAVTYSSGAYKDQMIATTDLFNQCTIKHTGTSASAPLAAGIIALALEVNPNLTWRDVQHIIVWTSEFAPVANNPGWQKNAAGLWFNTRLGFGLMNAHAFVKTAANWTTVPERKSCTVEAPLILNNTLSYGHSVTIPIETSKCSEFGRNVAFLEHVEVLTNVNYTTRGAIEVHLTSPLGTKVELLAPRKLDDSSKGFTDWTFMSVMTWGENGEGLWILKISDHTGPAENIGTIGKIKLTLHGTSEVPRHMQDGPRQYDNEYNRIRNRLEQGISEKTSNHINSAPSNNYYEDGADYFFHYY